jgi:hypothetical protein
MSEDNSFIGRTYFEGDVQMPVPPEYFLQRIYDYDALLVMFPSTARPGAYVIARRREKSPGLTSAALASVGNPDTRLCMAMGWVPVCAMFQAGISWNPDQIIARLKARDIRANGGADKVADQLEAQEAADEAATKKAIRDDLWNRSGDGWRTYQARTGASSIKFHDNLPVKEATVQQLPPLEAQQDGAPIPALTIGGEV